MTTLLDAVKMAYRKHHLDDPSIGWDELSDYCMMALCNEMGDKEFRHWVAQQDRLINGEALDDARERV